jgi:hypothetical protein
LIQIKISSKKLNYFSYDKQLNEIGKKKMSIKSLFKTLRVTYLAAIAVAAFMVTSNANASYIVDTGEGSSDPGGFGLTDLQKLAGQFTITESYIIDSVEGWFSATADGTVTASIFTNSGGSGSMSGPGGDIPKDELYFTQFLLDSPSAGNNAWDGAYDLSWALDPGTYWLVFEVRDGDSLISAGMPNNAPNPLDKYVYIYEGEGGTAGWGEPGPAATDWGMRISAVPVPAAVWLFGSGLIGLIGIARRKKA